MPLLLVVAFPSIIQRLEIICAHTRAPNSALGLSEEYICSPDSFRVYFYRKYPFVVLPLIYYLIKTTLFFFSKDKCKVGSC